MAENTPRRRSVLAATLLGGLGLVATGAASGCGAAPPGATLSDGVLPTREGGSARWRLAVPSSGRARGLVVVLHGYGGDADAAFDLGFADSTARTGLAVASVDGGNGYWHRRADGSDSGRLVREGLVPLALDRAGLPARGHIALLGWSMGGYGALLLAGDLGPGRVSGVVAASAALWRTAGETPAVAFDDAADYGRHTVLGRPERLRGIPVRLDCGLEDPFVAANRALAAELPGAEAHVEPGGHEDAWWSERAAAQMDWLAARA